jgi:hypothetical protein
MDGSKIERSAFSTAWHRKIGATLPKHLEGRVIAPNGKSENLKRVTTPADRAMFAKWVEESICRWEKIKPEVAPEREKLKRLAAEADKLHAAVQRIRVRAARLGADPGLATLRHTAEGDLYWVANRTAIELARWNRLWRPKKARPQSFDAGLTLRLQGDYRLFCGHVRGFDRLLTVIQAMRHEYPADFPELISSTLAKRKQRAK